ncbi:MAG TPA: hypothetical protein VIL01_15860 [Thermomicrobiales bacterium]
MEERWSSAEEHGSLLRVMRWLRWTGLALIGVVGISGVARGQTPEATPSVIPDLHIAGAQVVVDEKLEQLIFQQTVAGEAGGTVPEATGEMEAATVIGYVFPTTMSPADVGFRGAEGIVALAVTSHPDFDDTPLWDETGDGDYGNDGALYHSHWVLLGEDSRAPGGLSVVAVSGDVASALPPTSPGLPIYLDSPGFPVILRGQDVLVVVPAQRVHGQTDFRFDAVTATMRVSTDPNQPTLGVTKVHSVLSGDLSLPGTPQRSE